MNLTSTNTGSGGSVGGNSNHNNFNSNIGGDRSLGNSVDMVHAALSGAKQNNFSSKKIGNGMHVCMYVYLYICMYV